MVTNYIKKACLVIVMLSSFAVAGCSGPNVTIRTLRAVGEFSGHRVEYVQITNYGAVVAPMTVEYSVGGVYLFTFPDPSYDYVVYGSADDESNYLKAAFEIGWVTHDDLVAIAEAERPYDTAFNHRSSLNEERSS